MSLSFQDKKREYMIQKVTSLIKDSKTTTLEFWWSQKTDDVKHTGIALKFDHTSKVSLDFGGDLSTLEAVHELGGVIFKWVFSPKEKLHDAVLNMKLTGKTNISYFNAEKVDIIGKLVQLPLTNKVEIENAINLFTSIIRMDGGKYNLLENNCRAYVIKVAKLLHELPECTRGDWEAFEEKMQTLRSEDQSKYERLLELAKSSKPIKLLIHLIKSDFEKTLPLLPAEPQNAA